MRDEVRIGYSYKLITQIAVHLKLIRTFSSSKSNVSALYLVNKSGGSSGRDAHGYRYPKSVLVMLGDISENYGPESNDSPSLPPFIFGIVESGERHILDLIIVAFQPDESSYSD